MLNRDLLHDLDSTITLLGFARANIDHALDQPQDYRCSEQLTIQQLNQAKDKIQAILKIIEK